VIPSFEVSSDNTDVEQKVRIDVQQIQSEGTTLTCFVWDEHNNVSLLRFPLTEQIYLAEQQTVHYLNGSNLEKIMSFVYPNSPSLLVLTQKHLIMVYESG